MNLLYIHQYFATPRGATGTRSYEFARRWVAGGHRVVVLTTQAQLTPEDFREGGAEEPDRPRRTQRLRFDGVEVLARRIPYHQTMSRAARVMAFLRFMAWATARTLLSRNVDVVFATSTPLSVGIPALCAWWLRRRPFVFEVRDLWPDLPIAFGAVRAKPWIALLRALERWIYNGARGIVALAPGPADLIRSRRRIREGVIVVPNAADLDFFRPDVDGSQVRRRWKWQDRFVLIHAGAMGPANGLDAVLRVANMLRDDPEILFVLVGEGGERARLEQEAKRKELTNVMFLDRRPKTELPSLLAAADVCLVTVAPLSIMEHNSANKLFDALSAGRPVLINYAGWQRDLIEEAGAGYGCSMGDDAALAERVRLLKADRAALAAMGRRARYLAETHFDRDVLARRVLDFIVSCMRRSTS